MSGGLFLPPIGRSSDSDAKPRSRSGAGGGSERGRRSLSALSSSHSNSRRDRPPRKTGPAVNAADSRSDPLQANRQRKSRQRLNRQLRQQSQTDQREPQSQRKQREPQPQPQRDPEPQPEPELESELESGHESRATPSIDNRQDCGLGVHASEGRWRYEYKDSPRADTAVSFAANPFLHSSCYASVDNVIDGMTAKASRALVQDRGSAVLADLATNEPAQAIAIVKQQGVRIVAAAASAARAEQAASIVQSLSRLILACVRAVETSKGVAATVATALETMLSDSEVAASREATASQSSAAELCRQIQDSGAEVRTCPRVFRTALKGNRVHVILSLA